MMVDRDYDHIERETKIGLLYDNIRVVKQRIEVARRRPAEPPWRRTGEKSDEVESLQNILMELEDDLIALEESRIDPEQRAEMKAEMFAESRLYGLSMEDTYSNIEYAFDTPYQQKLRRESWRNDWYEDDREVFESPCVTCNAMGDEWISADGQFVCYENCAEDALAFGVFLSYYCNKRMINESRKTEVDTFDNWHFEMEDE